MTLEYNGRSMRFNHEQDLFRVLRFMFGCDVNLLPIRTDARNGDTCFVRDVEDEDRDLVAVVRFDLGEEF
jgi:hypothetical protein